MSGLVYLQDARAITQLWLLGLREALQLQRCVVVIVYDKSNRIMSKLVQCAILNGAIFLGSLALWQLLLAPLLRWVLAANLAPAWGSGAFYVAAQALEGAVQAAWLLPAYAVTLVINTLWYQEIAASAHQVLTQQAQRDGTPTKTSGPAAAAVAAAASAGTKSGGSSSGGGNSSNSSSVTEVVAQELYRTVLFVVFYAEVFVLGRLPLIGRALYFTFLSWLYAFYCYDYKWEALKVKLPERLAYFERRWAFFAGFGLPMSLATCACPFYLGAGLVALLFPLFILVANDSHPDSLHDQIIRLASWPVQALVRCVRWVVSVPVQVMATLVYCLTAPALMLAAQLRRLLGGGASRKASSTSPGGSHQTVAAPAAAKAPTSLAAPPSQAPVSVDAAGHHDRSRHHLTTATARAISSNINGSTTAVPAQIGDASVATASLKVGPQPTAAGRATQATIGTVGSRKAHHD